MKERNREETRGEETRGKKRIRAPVQRDSAAASKLRCVTGFCFRPRDGDGPQILSESVSGRGATLHRLSEMFQTVAFSRRDAHVRGRSTSESSAQVCGAKQCVWKFVWMFTVRLKDEIKKIKKKRDVASVFSFTEKFFLFFFGLKNGLVLSSLSSEKLDFPLSLQANSPSDQCSNALMKNSWAASQESIIRQISVSWPWQAGRANPDHPCT